MSDTDDTDILLLIPPNFFLERSSGSEDSFLESSRTVVRKPPSCTSQVIGKLVTHVHCLEDRLELLELSTASESYRDVIYRNRTLDLSVDRHSIDRKSSTFPRLKKRKVLRQKRREHSLSLESTSSCGNNVPPLTITNYNINPVLNDCQMEGDVSSIVSTPSKKNDKLLLHEIDEYLQKVETYDTPETFRDSEPTLNSENVIRATGDYITQKFDSKSMSNEVKLPSGRVLSASILDKYIYLVQNQPDDQGSNNIKQNTESGSNILKTEAPSPAYRKLNFESKDTQVQPTSTPKHSQFRRPHLDKFRPSLNKVYDKATKVLEDYQNYNTEDTISSSLLECPQNVNKPLERSDLAQKRFIDSIDTDLISLSDLWGGKGERTESGKLEEERLKREHCEAMIQELQKKLLNQQEKLAVAMKVDGAKDVVISKLRQAWIEVTNGQDREKSKLKAAQDRMAADIDKFRIAASNAQKKSDHFEAELYKTLDLAHDYQEKCKQLEKEKQTLDSKMQDILQEKDHTVKRKDAEIDSLKQTYDTVIMFNKQSQECIKKLENALEKEKQDHEVTKSQLLELTCLTSNVQEDIAHLSQERDIEKCKVKEERSRNQVLEKLVAERDGLIAEGRKREDHLENELLELRKQLETQKSELKSYYQKQLEEAVLSKLQEFQTQLDQAEREMDHDARMKETNILDSYNKQISRLQEQHKLEVSVLEEKHKEEMILYRLQLAQANENITLLESKISSYRRRRGELASQLYSVMQAQWRQALQILTQPNAHLHDVTASTPIASVEEYLASAPTMPAEPSTAKCDGRLSDKILHFDGPSDNELHNYLKQRLEHSALRPPLLEMGLPELENLAYTRHAGQTAWRGYDFLSKPVGSLDTSDVNVEKDFEEPTSDRPRHKGKHSSHKPPWKS